MPDVIAVYTAADLALEPLPSRFNPAVARPLLATDRVRFVGEPVAVVVAATAAAAADAADRVIVDYEIRTAYVDPLAAIDGDALFDAAGSNVVVDSTAMGMPGFTDDGFFAGCEVVVSGHFKNQRMAPCPLEPRAAAAAWVDGRLYEWLSTQHAQGARDLIAKVNGLDAAETRVITPDVGGGFGAKITPYPEELLLGRLAKELGRPVAWAETRSESMISLGHGRAQLHDVTIGGTREGPGDSLPTRHPAGLRRFGGGWRRARIVHDPADGLGRVRHRQHRVPGTIGRSPTPRRSSPSAVPAGRRRRLRSSGPSTCSPPSSDAIRRRSAGST